MSNRESTIPVMRPRLPTADRLLPFLRRIDSAGVYSNAGPLSLELERRLADRWNVDPDRVVTVANATLGLQLCLQTAASPGGVCAMPSWTFVASAHAAIGAGIEPWFLDVSPETWALTPSEVGKTRNAAPNRIAAVMTVLPFGHPVDISGWEAFSASNRVPVVVDAAAAIDAHRPGSLPTVFSLHATKLLPAGEGGAICAPDAAFAGEVRRRSNFGFLGNRSAERAGTNAKLSEYHAAVALASLETFEEKRGEMARLAREYTGALASEALPLPEIGESWVSTTMVVRLAKASAVDAAAGLRSAGIDSRMWWGHGCHLEPTFQSLARTHLPVTEALAENTLGLPFHAELSAHEIERVVEALARLHRTRADS